MNKERYKEEYEEGSDLLWPSDKEDKITRQFYEDLSNLSKNINYSKKKKLKLFEQVVRIICLLYTSPSPRDRQKSRMPSSA